MNKFRLEERMLSRRRMFSCRKRESHSHSTEDRASASLVPDGCTAIELVLRLVGLERFLELLVPFSLNLHRLRIRIVDIGFALLEQLLAVTKDSLEVIRCAAEVIILNLQKIHVLQ